MSPLTRSISFGVVLWLGLPATGLFALQRDHGEAAGGQQLGRVDFEVSCESTVHESFERGVALLHSFYFSAATEAFDGVLSADPSCAMAYWGKALARMGNPFAGTPGTEASQSGLEELETAAGLDPATDRESDWIAAATLIYRDHGQLDGRSRMLAYESAMRELHERYPEDPEAAIFYAQALIANSPPSDPTFERLLQASAILEPLFLDRPDHPGLAHYLIHAHDVPPLAEQGLDAARRYASIAPDAPHALHMPSHVFTRLGMWDESIETNRRSADLESGTGAAHPLDYMVYAYLQQGRDQAALEAVQEVYGELDDPQDVLAYNLVAMPARYALERGRWADAAGLDLTARANTTAESVTRFARGMGAARSGDAAAASGEAAALARIRDALREEGDEDWAHRIDAQRVAIEAWIALDGGDEAAARRLAREAAESEEAVEKHPVTPGPILPARELEGDLLLQLGQLEEALAAYEANLEREPNRARSIYGAARAAQQAGHTDVAQRYYTELLELMDRADDSREEVAEARTFLAAR